jgi:hypothetical protein
VLNKNCVQNIVLKRHGKTLLWRVRNIRTVIKLGLEEEVGGSNIPTEVMQSRCGYSGALL